MLASDKLDDLVHGVTCMVLFAWSWIVYYSNAEICSAIYTGDRQSVYANASR